MPPADPPRARPRRRRWLWALVVVALLGLAGPTLVGLTPLPQSLLAGALPASAGRLTAASTSLSWTGPLELGGLQLRDPNDAVLLSAETVRVEGGLIGLLAGQSAPLRVRVDRPRVDLVIVPEGTNFDALIGALKESSVTDPPAEPAGQPTVPNQRRPLEVTVDDAAVLVTDTATTDAWLVDGLGLRLTDPARGFDAISFEANGKVAPYVNDQPAGAGGTFVAKVGPSNAGRRAEVQAAGVPLVLLRPMLRRADATASISGVLDLDGAADWRPAAEPFPGTTPGDLVRTLAAGAVRSNGLARLRDVELVGRATQGGPIRLKTIDIPWRVSGNAGDTLALEQLELTSGVGRGEITGAIRAGEVDRWMQGLADAPRDLRIEARLDFDRLARVAPQFVRLRRGARIDAGRVELTAAFDAGRLDARLATGRLAGVAQGRRVEWREPIDVRLAATQRAPAAGLAGWSLASLDAKSTFFHATAEGDAARLSGEADFDLDLLARELAPLIDLGEVQLAGRGQAQFLVDRNTNAQAWRLQSRGGVRDLLIGDPGAPLANEPRLDFDTRLNGSLSNLRTPPTGTVTLTAGDDRLTAMLAAREANAPQPFDVVLLGDAARWWRRAASVAPQLPTPEALRLAGRIDLSAKGSADAAGGRVDRFRIELTRFGLDTTAIDPDATPLRLSNERLEAQGTASWLVSDRSIRVPSAKFTSSFVTASAEDAAVSLANPAASRGRIDLRADLVQLAGRLAPRGEPPRYSARGLVMAMAKVRGTEAGVGLTIKADGRELALIDRTPDASQATAAQTVWTEPRAELDAELEVALPQAADGSTAYALQVRDARVKSQSINGSFGGRIADVAALRGVDLNGGIDYDLARLTPILWPTVGDGVRLVGRDRVTFRLATDESATAEAPALARLRATVAAPWESADLFGLSVGPGRLAANLQRGLVRVDPLDVAIAGGRLTTEAAATLAPAPATVSLKPGPLVTDVAMSQQVNERILKFIAPVLADATRIDGRFSVTLSELTFPLDPPPSVGPPPGRAAGVLDIHRIRVTPGPSVAEWVGVVQQIVGLARDGVQSVARPSDSVLVAIDNTPVDFQLLDGRVYHRGLRFNVGDAVVESAGSVGIDETLDLLLSVPIQDAWVQREPVLLGRLRGQSLRIPIRGTFKKPKVDKRAFQELSGRVLESAAAGAVESGLNKLFEKLRSR